MCDAVVDYDVLWVYGAPFLQNLKPIMAAKRAGKKIVYGLDDFHWRLPEWRPEQAPEENVAVVDVLCCVADHLIASTPELVAPMRHPEKTTVARNLIEVDAYGLPTPPTDDERIRILWAGAPSHRGDLELIDAACCRIMQLYGDRVEFIFVGGGPCNVVRDYWQRGVRVIPWQDLQFHWKTLNYLKPHIALSPMVNCEFNLCKSNIRVLESWAMNAALVYSPVGEYTAAEPEVTGLPATSEEEWVAQMVRLIESRELRESLAAAGYQRVRQDWDWNSAQARQKHWWPTVERIEAVTAK